MSRFSRPLALVLLWPLATSCAHYSVNAKLDHYAPDYGYRVSNTSGDPDDSQTLLISMTFSGGGTRAAAFAYGVLLALRDTEITFDGKARRLSDEIDIVSSVSGSSVTAAYFALYGDRIFDDFESRFLRKNVQRDLELRFLSPFNWVRLLSPYFGRSDLTQEYFDQLLFHGATYANLIGNFAPATIVNATDVALGVRFSFDQEQFDELCSNLSSFPISRAVVASLAVPVLLSPVTLKNYAGDGCGYQLPEWVEQELANGYTTSRRYQEALRIAEYVSVGPKSFVHLVDGSLADNLGLRGTIERATGAGGVAQLLDTSGFRHFHRVVHIVVNAQIEPDSRWRTSERAPGLFATLSSSTSVPLNRYNFETVESFKASQAAWLKELRDIRCKRAPSSAAACEDIDGYFIELSFAQHPDSTERKFLQSLPTTLHLTTTEEQRVIAAARVIVDQSPEFQRLVHDLAASEPQTP